ncbi:MAG: hypothetical protein IMY86_13235, partial [Chloroflexi bacterium]|nr:hypothetical protein [Chloroflexota bacterium]
LIIPRLTGGDRVLLAFPSRGGDVELYLLKLGQDERDGILLAEDVEWVSTTLWLLEDGQYRLWGDGFGGFVPNTNHVLLWYEEEGDTVMQQIRIGDREPTEVIELSEGLHSGKVVNDFEFIFLEESRDGGERCYVARPGSEAERVAKADECDISRDGSIVYFSEEKRGETTVSVVGVNGKNEQVVLDEVEGVESYQFSADASHVAYVQEDDGEARLYLVERRSGEKIEISDQVYRVNSYGFAPGSDVLYYVVREDSDDEEVQLYTSDGDRPIAEEMTISARFSQDGRYLAYAVEDYDGDETLYVHPMMGGDDVEVADGDDIDFGFLSTAPSRLVVLVTEEDGEFTLSSANLDGGDVIELLKEDDGAVGSIQYVPGEPTLYVGMEDEDGEEMLFVTPVDKATGFRLLEGWASIELLNRSAGGRQLAFAALEDSGDDPVLYSIAVEDGADPIELDDDGEDFYRAVFSANGQFVLYSARTGSDFDELEVRRVRADGKERFETLYEEAGLVDVCWDDMDPFSSF